MKTQTQQFVEIMTKQAQAILSVKENREWIDNPEKLMIACLYRLSKDMVDFDKILKEVTK